MAHPLHYFKRKVVKIFFKLNFKNIIFLVVIVSMGYTTALALNIYQENDTQLENRPVYGEAFRIGWHSKPTSLDPFAVSDSIAMPIMHLIFDKLVRQSPDVQFVPSLAKKWEISEDGLTYDFFLREDVYFHDGTQLTSKDVLKTFELFSDPRVSPSFSDYFNKIKQFSASSDFVFTIKLREPYAPLLRLAWQPWIVSHHKIEQDGEKNSYREEIPMGSGPYVFESMAENGNIVLKANENFRDGRPYLDKVELKVYPEKGQVWSAFVRGELDMAFYISRLNYLEIKDNEAFKVFKFLPSGGYSLVFNMQNSLMRNSELRKAISSSVNRSEMIEKLENGNGVAIDGIFHPDSWVYDESKKTSTYNPLIMQNFLKDENLRPDQRRINILVDYRNQNLTMIAKLIRQQLIEVGLIVDFRTYSNLEELKDLFNDPSENIHACLIMHNLNVEPNAASRYWETEAAFNVGKYSNYQVDYLFQSARSMHDRTARLEAYQEIQRIVFEENPAIFLYIPYAYHVAAKNVQNAEKMVGLYTSIYEIVNVYKSKSS